MVGPGFLEGFLPCAGVLTAAFAVQPDRVILILAV